MSKLIGCEKGDLVRITLIFDCNWICVCLLFQIAYEKQLAALKESQGPPVKATPSPRGPPVKETPSLRGPPAQAWDKSSEW